MSKICSKNPFTEEIIQDNFPILSDAEIIAKIELAHEAFLSWRKTSLEERRVLFHKLADVIESSIDETAQLQTLEM